MSPENCYPTNALIDERTLMTPPSAPHRSPAHESGRTRQSWTMAAATGGLALVVGLVAACGTSASGAAVAADTGAASAPASGQASQGGGPASRNGGVRAAASGTIAAVAAGTIQVQSATAQTTVNYSDSTTFTNSQTVDLPAVTVGSCITAAAIPPAGAAPSAGASASAAPPSAVAPSSGASSPNSGPFTATVVQLRDPVDGACAVAGGFGGGPGGFVPGGGAPNGGAMPSGGAVPSGAPVPTDGAMPGGGDAPSGAPNGAGRTVPARTVRVPAVSVSAHRALSRRSPATSSW